MAGGVAFDPAEFAAYKSGLPGAGGGSREPVPAADAFDPGEFEAFKASRASGQRPSRTAPNPFDREGAPASFDERFDRGAPMSRADGAPRVAGAEGPGRSIGSDQGAADALYAGLRRTADEQLVGPPSATNAAAAFAMRAGNAAGLNLPRNAGAAIASIPGVGNGRGFSANYALAKDQEDALSRQYPKTAIAGTVAGIGAGALSLPAFKAAEGANAVGRAVANVKTGAAYGFVSELADSKDPYAAAKMAGVGGLAGGVGGAIIEKAVPAVGRLFARNAPFRDANGVLTGEATAALREAGIDPAAITPELAQSIEAAFAAKGPSPAAAREALAADSGITLSRGQATLDPRALDLEARAMAGRSGERAQGVAQDFAGRQAGQIAAAGERLQGMAAGTFDRVASPQAAYEAAAERARQAAAQQVEQSSIAQRGVDDALRAVRGRGETDALDGATTAVQGVRDAAEQARGAYRAAYGEVAQIPGRFAPGAMDRVGASVRARLNPQVPIDEKVTPAAYAALQDLDNVPALFNLKPGEGPTLQQYEMLRRRMRARYPSTSQNATDRMGLDEIVNGLEGHVEDTMAAGLFGPRQAAAAPRTAVDDFPGLPAHSGASAPLPAAGGAPAASGQPETLTRWLARGGGVPLDAEARAADLHRLYVPGQGTLARNGAPTWDQIRVRLAEDGFLPPDLTGAASARDIADWAREAIHAERTGGRATVRMGEEAGAGRRAADGIADMNADHAAMVDRQARRLAIDLEGYGIGPRDVDHGALNEAAERMVLGRHTGDGVDAYEAALTSRETAGAPRSPAQGADAVPFDGPTAVAASDALPGADMAPLEAMRRARGLFREYRQAFSPRGPGDVAGQRLQRIVERDASPNEVASMLFGSPGTGKVQAGQLQTLARVREAVGADSEAWRATQQALIARHLGGEGRDLAGRLDYLLRGEGRPLTLFLTEEQRTGLGQLRGAVSRAQSTGAPMPTWASDLERSGFDPNRVAHGLFGGSELGGRVGAAQEARAAKAFLGEDSPEWAGLRQAAIQRLLATGEGPGGAGKLVQQAAAFTDGSGKGVAEALFSRAEIGEIRRFAVAVRTTLTPDGRLRPEASSKAELVKLAFERLSHMVALHVGGLPAAAASVGTAKGRDYLAGRLAAGRAGRSFDGGAPRTLALPAPALPLDRLAIGEGLSLGQR